MKYIRLYTLLTYITSLLRACLPNCLYKERISPQFCFLKQQQFERATRRLKAIGTETATNSYVMWRAQCQMKLGGPDSESGNKLLFSSTMSLWSCHGIFLFLFNVVMPLV